MRSSLIGPLRNPSKGTKNAYFPFTLRDTLLRAADVGLYQLRWTSQILDEMEGSLVRTRRMSKSASARLRSIMEDTFSEARVTGYEALVPSMQNDVGDLHVVAAAVKCGAQVIVTSNVKHFMALPDGLEAQSPDEFVCNLFDLDPAEMVALLRRQASDLQNPPVAFRELLERLRRVTPHFVTLVVEHLAGA